MTVTYGDWIHRVVAILVLVDLLSIVVTRAVPMRYGPECTLFWGMHVIAVELFTNCGTCAIVDWP